LTSFTSVSLSNVSLCNTFGWTACLENRCGTT
jgi:hypothetical protein